MKLTNEQIEQILKDAPEGATHYDSMATWKYKNLERGTFLIPDGTGYKITEFYPNETISSLDDLREILFLRKEIEIKSEYIKQLEQDAARGESCVNWVV